MIDVKLWSLEMDEKNNIIPSELESLINTETEQQLEDLIVNNPNLLMDGLILVGRQTPTSSGFLDLLGVDKDGYLIVFELKRGKLSRDAVTQVIDYASYLADLDRDNLCEHISNRSGTYGINIIEDFEELYHEQFGGDLELLDEPPKMVLVGLGYDDNTKRMIKFLSSSGVNISLITFYGYKMGDQTFLAKQIEVSQVETREVKKEIYSKESNEAFLQELIKKNEVEDIFKKSSDIVRNIFTSTYAWPGRTCRSFSLVERTDAGKPTNRVYIAIYVNEKLKRSIDFHIYQRAIDANKEFFKILIEKDKDLKLDKYGNMHIIIKSTDDWEQKQELLENLLKRIYVTWEETTNKD